jgi:hypothetical protein
VFLTPDTYTGVLLRRSTGGGAAYHLVGGKSGDFWLAAKRPGKVTGWSGRRAPMCCILGGSGYCGSDGPFGTLT